MAGQPLFLFTLHPASTKFPDLVFNPKLSSVPNGSSPKIPCTQISSLKSLHGSVISSPFTHNLLK